MKTLPLRLSLFVLLGMFMSSCYTIVQLPEYPSSQSRYYQEYFGNSQLQTEDGLQSDYMVGYRDGFVDQQIAFRSYNDPWMMSGFGWGGGFDPYWGAGFYDPFWGPAWRWNRPFVGFGFWGWNSWAWHGGWGGWGGNNVIIIDNGNQTGTGNYRFAPRASGVSRSSFEQTTGINNPRVRSNAVADNKINTGPRYNPLPNTTRVRGNVYSTPDTRVTNSPRRSTTTIPTSQVGRTPSRPSSGTDVGRGNSSSSGRGSSSGGSSGGSSSGGSSGGRGSGRGG